MTIEAQVTVAVLADVRLHRDGLAQLLAECPELILVGTAPADRDALEPLRIATPDIVLLEASAACSTSIVQDLAHTLPRTRVVAYGILEEDREAVACAEAGVAGYVSQDASSGDLLHAILAVARGEFHCSPRVSALLMRRVSILASERRAPAADASLTPRQHQIIALIDEGLSNKEIARRLGIELSTVKTHVHHVLRKLHATRRIQAAGNIRRARVTT